MSTDQLRRRVSLWPERLEKYIAEREKARFAWGVHDCCRFAAGAVEAMTGADLMADLPAYSSAEEADLVLGDVGLIALVDARLPRREKGEARRGDVALVGTEAGEKGDALFIVEGNTIVGAGARGLVRHPRAAIRIAWAV